MTKRLPVCISLESLQYAVKQHPQTGMYAIDWEPSDVKDALLQAVAMCNVMGLSLENVAGELIQDIRDS